MIVKRLLLLALAMLPGLAQQLRVEVRADTGPVEGAVVTVNGASLSTDPSGVATTAVQLGKVDVSVSKEGFLPAKASLMVDEAREWRIAFELKPEERREEEVTVFATRNDARLQDLPLRVEVLGADAVNEHASIVCVHESGGWRVEPGLPEP